MSDSRVRETYQLSSLCVVVKHILFLHLLQFWAIIWFIQHTAYWSFLLAIHFIKMDKIHIKTKPLHPSPQCLGIVSEQSVQSWWRTRRWQYLLDTTGKLYIWTQINLPAHTRTLQVLVRQNSHLELGDPGTKFHPSLYPGATGRKESCQKRWKVVHTPVGSHIS